MATPRKPRKEPDAHLQYLVKRQARVQRHVHALKGIHENRRSLDERAFYPAHDKRKESPVCQKANYELVTNQDRPCLACGVTKKTLKSPNASPYHAKQMGKPTTSSNGSSPPPSTQSPGRPMM